MFEFIKRNLIIFSLVIFFVLSVFYLFYSESRPLQDSWWSVYFEDAKNRELNFIIENHSYQNNFNWEVYQNRIKVQEGGIECLRKEKCLVKIENKYQGKVLIRVFSREELREIYKNFLK